jgi:metallo-beta-lactamase family protein
MKLTFYGAAREVTGSCSCIEANGKKILIDCGMQQGDDQKENQQFPFNASDIDFVILTHAHIDHSGRLPLLVKEGFRGTIYTIEATYDLLTIMLKDSAKIQESDAKWENKKSGKTGKDAAQPLYTMADALRTLELVQSCSYGRVYEIYKGIKFNFIDAGHILGSASVELFLSEGGASKKIVFSGDIGNINQPIIKDPQYIESGDYAVMEATYGDRNHENNLNYKQEFAKILDETLASGGNVIIPSFAVGRTQGLLYLIREIKEEKLVKNSSFPVYVDSPLATEATRLYDDDLHIYGDTETRAIVKKGANPISFPGLSFTDSVQDSIALNHDPVPKVIISSSGMCEAGRIKHHLKHNLERRESCVIIAGFQARGTLGRALLDGEKKVSIFGQEIEVVAKIYNFTGLSAHADKDGLIKWITSFDKKPDKVFVVHVEESVIDGFLKTLTGLGFSALAPSYKSAYDLG